LRKLLQSDFVPKFNPFEEYLENLPKWDEETDYILQLALAVKTTNDIFWSIVLKKWIVALVGSMIIPDVINHAFLILSGKQGVYKTTWLKKFIPKALQEYAYFGAINPKDKDSLCQLAENMLIIIDELQSFANSDISGIKEMVTKPFVKLRRPYGTIHEHLPHRASFAGTTNEKEFLNDTTGLRRFLTFEVLEIDNSVNVPIDMVYAQAYHLFKNGFVYWFDETENDQINRHNEQFRLKSIEEELLLSNYRKCTEEDATDFLSTTEILDRLLAKIDRGSRAIATNTSLYNLGRVLRKHEFLRLKKRGEYVYALQSINISEGETGLVYGFVDSEQPNNRRRLSRVKGK
jgi:predicted P-loop ATPase